MTRSARALAGVAVVLIAPVLARVGVLSPSGAFTLATAACFVAMALSLDIVLGHAGQLTLGHGALLAVGALTSALVTGRWYLPFAVGVVVAVAVTAGLAGVLAVPALRLRTISLALVTMAVGIAAEQSLFRWQWLTHGSAGLTLPRPEVGSFVFTDAADYAAVAALVAVAVWFVDGAVANSAFGRALHLLRDDERVAAAFGVDVHRTTVKAFVVAGALAGAAGAAYGHLLLVTTAETFSFAAISLPLVGIVVMGGAGSRTGIALAAAAYGALPRLLTPLEGWQNIVGGALFLAAVLRNPAGIAAVLARRADAGGWRSTGTNVVETGTAQDLVVHEVSVSRCGARIVHAIDLRIAAGRVVALVGANGSGKSTLADAVSGFLPLDGGNVVMGRQDVTTLPPHLRRRAGMARTFQERGLPPELSVREVLLAAQHVVANEPLVATVLGLPRIAAEEERLEVRAHAAAAAIGLADRPGARVGTLSVGQRRMLEVRCALLGRPSVLVLDEPAAGLAPDALHALAAEIAAVAGDGVAVLLIEHRRELVDLVADTVFELEAGVLR